MNKIVEQIFKPSFYLPVNGWLHVVLSMRVHMLLAFRLRCDVKAQLLHQTAGCDWMQLTPTSLIVCFLHVVASRLSSLGRLRDLSLQTPVGNAPRTPPSSRWGMVSTDFAEHSNLFRGGDDVSVTSPSSASWHAPSVNIDAGLLISHGNSLLSSSVSKY